MLSPKARLLAFALVTANLLIAARGLNLRPVIGIISQPLSHDDFDHGVKPDPNQPGSEFIPAGYVKFLEAAGARVVPVSYKLPKEKLEKVVSSLNGLLFPGGGLDLKFGDNGFTDASKYIFDLAIKDNDNGGHFSLWGTCQGFQLLNVLASGNDKLLKEDYDSENIMLPLNFDWAAVRKSKMFAKASQSIMNNLATKNITPNFHHCGVTPKAFVENKLDKFFLATSWNLDLKGQAFLSTVEGIKYPFFGVQYHPEKTLFEWPTTQALDHTAEAIEAMYHLAAFFVNEARLSNNHFPEEEKKALIYNYMPTYTAGTGNMQVYYSDFTNWP